MFMALEPRNSEPNLIGSMRLADTERQILRDAARDAFGNDARVYLLVPGWTIPNGAAILICWSWTTGRTRQM